MEPLRTPREVRAPMGGNEWYAFGGHDKDGTVVDVQIFADSKDDAASVAHGCSIMHGLSTTTSVEHIGSRKEFDEFIEE